MKTYDFRNILQQNHGRIIAYLQTKNSCKGSSLQDGTITSRMQWKFLTFIILKPDLKSFGRLPWS